MKLTVLLKRMISMLCLFSILFTSSIAYADSPINNEVKNESINLEEIEIHLSDREKVEIAVEQLDYASMEKVKEYISKIGIEEFEKMIKEEFKIKEETEVLLPSPKNSQSIFASDGSHYKDSVRSRRITFERGYVVEYVSTVGITVNIRDNRITNINNTSLDISGMSAGGSYNNVSFSNYIASNGSNAGTTANYDVRFLAYVGDILPITYTYRTFDNVTAYVSDF